MGPQARMAAGQAPLPENGVGAGESVSGPFVINLCSSTTPMALAHPDSPELKRFSFFVSRRREDNRERFRLHMGYFTTLAEAEEWLNVIRDVYPGAWAGEAPGKKLRARAAAAALATQLPPPPSAARPAAPPASAVVVPTLQAAPAQAAAPSAAETIMAPVLASMPPPRMAAPSPIPPQPVTKAPVPAPSVQSTVHGVRPVEPNRPAVAATPAQEAAKPAARKPIPAALSGSNVREVMASLDETGETRQMRVPPGLRSPVPAAAIPAAAARAQVAVELSRAKAPVARQQSTAVEAPAATSLSDTQVLKILEQRRTESGERGGEEASSGISLLKPDDTQTRRALKEAIQDNAPVSFAVQLHWSVQPVQLDKVPPLAIFSAYTLYTVEGSREGRKWYGLRLGFFSDAISAKQVAHYVRSEFSSVAVVPVSPQEKSRASDEETQAATGAFQKKHTGQKVEEFKLFEDEGAVGSASPSARAPAAPVKPAPKAVARTAPPKKNKPLGRVRAKDQRTSKTLEETLEILGASELEIDNGRGETLNESGVRHLRVEVQKNTPFARLLDRLAERVRKN